MIIKHLAHFFEMGGYALYVWLAYGALFLMLMINVFLPRRKQKQLLKKLRTEMEENTEHESRS